jgi:hypothetical protein
MKFPEGRRVVRGDLATKPGDPGGVFLLKNGGGVIFRCIVTSGDAAPIGHPAWGWDHVSVTVMNSPSNRCPKWEEMCWIKEQFWDPEDAVMQLHPPRSTWVNNHPICLHLWRPLHKEIPLPDPMLVGLQGVEPGEIERALGAAE